MNLGELRDLARAKLDDKVEPYLWSDEFLNGSINRAQDEAFVRMGGVADDYTPQMTKAILVSGSAVIPLDPSVLKVESITAGLTPLVATTASALSLISLSWESITGAPTSFIADQFSIRVFPVPLVDVPVTMQVRRGALVKITNDAQQPELPYSLHTALLHFVLSEAYELPDSDISNPDASAKHAAAFDGVFGPRPTAKFQSIWNKTPARSAALMRRM